MSYRERLIKKRDKKIEEMFNLYDIDENKFITKDELIFVSSELEIRKFFDEMNKDKDTFLSLSEIKVYYILSAGLEICKIEEQIKNIDKSINFIKKYSDIIKQIRMFWKSSSKLNNLNYNQLEKLLKPIDLSTKNILDIYNSFKKKKNETITFGEFVSFIINSYEENDNSSIIF